jgi:Pentapeptide repeats (8 copies)
MQKVIKTMIGYKATDKDIKCRGIQFVLGEWSEPIVGDLVECENGYHFCEQLPGVWSYYSEPGTRVWKIEAEDVLDTPFQPGTDYKRVARRVRFIEEIFFDEKQNSGDWNSGDGNSGDWNTGYGNSGNRNSGDGNSGDWNTGDRNSGDGNATDYSSGFFNEKPEFVTCFGVRTKYTRSEFIQKFPEYWSLCVDLGKDEVIQFAPYQNLPGITKKKLESLHKAHIAKKSAKNG